MQVSHYSKRHHYLTSAFTGSEAEQGRVGRRYGQSQGLERPVVVREKPR